MPDEVLDYEGMLSALQGLLGQKVGVMIELHFNCRLRPLAALRGVLSSGDVADLSKGEGARLGYPGGESVYVGAPSDPGVPS